VRTELESIVTTELDSLGYELVELRIGGSRSRPVLDIRIERRDRRDVQVADCERASRAVEVRLDAAPAVMSSRYVLEVSSPGMERPLRSLADWQRFVGRRATVKSRQFTAVGGWIEAEIVSAMAGESHATVVLRDGKGVDHVLALPDVQEARLAFHWQPQG